MRKFALLLAASMLVTAPLVAMSTTDTYAAAKAKKASKGSAKGGGESGGDPNTRFIRALGDLGASLGQPNRGGEGKASKGGKGGGKAAKGGGKKGKRA